MTFLLELGSARYVLTAPGLSKRQNLTVIRMMTLKRYKFRMRTPSRRLGDVELSTN